MDRRTFLLLSTGFGASVVASEVFADMDVASPFIDPVSGSPLLCTGALRFQTPQWWVAQARPRPAGSIYVDGALLATRSAGVDRALRADFGMALPAVQLNANFVAAQLSLLRAREAHAAGSLLACPLGTYGFKGVLSLSGGEIVDSDTLLHDLWTIALDLTTTGKPVAAEDCATVVEIFRFLQRLP